MPAPHKDITMKLLQAIQIEVAFSPMLSKGGKELVLIVVMRG
jgi:hypothetical protein